jgi:hypothetical protein
MNDSLGPESLTGAYLDKVTSEANMGSHGAFEVDLITHLALA